ncbi:MAG: D-alanyl-D-alanine carboxypeptidase family protein [Lachnospiraceae bacterium]
MRCTDRPNKSDNYRRMKKSDRALRRSKARRKRKALIRRMLFILVILCFVAVGVLIRQNKKEETFVAEYETSHYNKSVYRGTLYSADLCVVSENIDIEGAPETGKLKSAALFDVDEKKTDFAYNVHEKLYPASLTKLMTALVALENGELSDIVTVSENADSDKFAYDEQTCGIHEGDELTLKDLLGGLLIYSGNDNAVAIAEHIGGSVDGFAEMMNAKAKEIMATNSHFVNPNGLHDDDHYTTAYDIYLIFNECIKYDEFIEIIKADSYTADIKRETDTAEGSDAVSSDSANESLSDNPHMQIIQSEPGYVKIKWEPTNYYAQGETELPKTGKVIGGKTGTTFKAGNCLVLLDESDSGKPYISIVMGAESKEILYQEMTTLIEAIPENE